jgi:hypothetical protein
MVEGSRLKAQGSRHKIQGYKFRFQVTGNMPVTCNNKKAGRYGLLFLLIIAVPRFSWRRKQNRGTAYKTNVSTLPAHWVYAYT